jgi:hypothetical protein
VYIIYQASSLLSLFVVRTHLARSSYVAVVGGRGKANSGDKDLKTSTPVNIALTKIQTVQLPSHLPESTANQSLLRSACMIELIQKARQAKERPAAEEAMEIKRRRMDAG